MLIWNIQSGNNIALGLTMTYLALHWTLPFCSTDKVIKMASARIQHHQHHHAQQNHHQRAALHSKNSPARGAGLQYPRSPGEWWSRTLCDHDPQPFNTRLPRTEIPHRVQRPLVAAAVPGAGRAGVPDQHGGAAESIHRGKWRFLQRGHPAVGLYILRQGGSQYDYWNDLFPAASELHEKTRYGWVLCFILFTRMALLHCRIRRVFLLTTIVTCWMFTLHRYGLGSQSPMAALGIRIRVRQCESAITIPFAMSQSVGVLGMFFEKKYYLHVLKLQKPFASVTADVKRSFSESKFFE